MKKYQDGGPAEAMQKAMGQKPTSTKKTMKYARKHGSGYIPPAKEGNSDSSAWKERYRSPDAKKYQDGGRTISEKAAMRKVSKGKGTIAYKYGSDSAPGTEGNKGEYIGYSRKARKDSASGKTMGTSMKDAKAPRPVMKTGGMVNPNAKVQAGKKAGSKGVKPGVNPKASASKVAKGRSGGTSVAPKTAIPEAMYGRMMKKGGMVKAKKK